MFFTRKIKQSNHKIFLFVLVLFLTPWLSHSQKDSSNVKYSLDERFFNHLYNFDFSKADSLIATIDREEESSIFYFLKVHYMRWYHLPIHDQEDSIIDLYREYLMITEDLGNSNTLNYTQINSALLSAEYNYNQGNYYRAFQSGSKIYDLMKDNLEKEPDQIEIKFLASLYHYYYHHYKEGNPFFGTMMWFFKAGDREIGLKWLEEVANQESIVRVEALIYLAHIYLRLENNADRAYQYAEKLYQLYPSNLKFYELLIESSLANDIESEFLEGVIQELKYSKKIYFKKYGFCYDAIFTAKFGELSRNGEILKLREALSFIRKNGGGNHLSSLLYYNLYELTGNVQYLKQKDKNEPYKYKLTGYSQEQTN